MKLKYLLTILTISSFSLLFFSSCDDEDDPCNNAKVANAEFKAYDLAGFKFESWNYETRMIECDTFFTSGITFNTVDKVIKKCTWKVGFDPRIFEGDNLFLVFDKPYGPVKITCMVEKDILEDCFSSKNSRYDTFTKQIVIIDYKDAPYVGNFRGYVESKPDSIFEIKIDSLYKNGSRFRIYNFFNYCSDTIIDFQFEHSYNEFYFWIPPYPCMHPIRAHGVMSKDKINLTIEFYIEEWVSGNNWIISHDKFIGKKIN
ncbi:MAG: hypothetical protein U9R42_04225 [Bacteroidota bacterium]|nr:hypothetical protein [Bacteroidota bacterium]